MLFSGVSEVSARSTSQHEAIVAVGGDVEMLPPAPESRSSAAPDPVEVAIAENLQRFDEASNLIMDAAFDAKKRGAGPAEIADALANIHFLPREMTSGGEAAARWLRANPGLHDDNRHFKELGVMEVPLRKADAVFWQLMDLNEDIDFRAKMQPRKRHEGPAPETVAAIIEICYYAMRKQRG